MNNKNDNLAQSLTERLKDKLKGIYFDDESGLPVVSLDLLDFTAIDTFLRCGKLFEFIYVHGKRRPPSVALEDGSSHHKALHENNISMLNNGKTLMASQMTDIYVQEFSERIKKAEVTLGQDFKRKLEWDDPRDVYLGRAKSFHNEYLRNHARDLAPKLAEEPFSKVAEVAGERFTLAGKIDLVTESAVQDYKVTSKIKSDRDAWESIQLSLYSWATLKTEAGFVCLVKTKTPYIGRVPTTRDPSRWAWALEVAASVVKAWKANIFPLARPDGLTWWCSQKFCGMWSSCRGKYEQPFIKEDK